MVRRQVFCLLALGLTLSACGTVRSGTNSGGLLETKGEGGLLNASPHSPSEVTAETPASDRSLEGDVHGVKLRNRTFDIPVVYNEEVDRWIDYFTTSGRKHFAVYLERKARIEPVIAPRLKKAGLPQDLIYLSMIESGFSTAAYSHAGASGPWQFIRSTGRLYGLESNWWRDERRDPEKATDAAIEYLGRLHAEFGDWSLACAAYNSGEIKIRNAVSRLGTRNFWEIARHRRALRRETRDYVPKMMAAAIVGKNAELFGFQSYPSDPSLLNYEEVEIPKAENLRTIARIANVDRGTLSELNPELLRCCTPPQRESYVIRVPKGESAKLLGQAIQAGEIGRYADFRRYVIRRGDSISRIASHTGVPAEAILSMNEIRNLRALKPGTELVIPDRGRAPVAGRMIASHEGSFTAPKGKKPLIHVVQKGDTLDGISHRYSVRVEQIRRWNGIGSAKKLRPGRRIKLYVRNENSETI
jgi:membrane-bound lytic murein transglycosylase D